MWSFELRLGYYFLIDKLQLVCLGAFMITRFLIYESRLDYLLSLKLSFLCDGPWLDYFSRNFIFVMAAWLIDTVVSVWILALEIVSFDSQKKKKVCSHFSGKIHPSAFLILRLEQVKWVPLFMAVKIWQVSFIFGNVLNLSGFGVLQYD